MARKPKADAETDAPPQKPEYSIEPMPKRDIPFTPEKFTAYCDLIGEGMSMRGIARAHIDMPTPGVFLSWVEQHPDLHEQYARARDKQQHVYADDQTDIADTDPDPARARNRIEARRWHSSKLMPKVYGDRTQMEIAASVKHELPTVADVQAAKKAILDKL